MSNEILLVLSIFIIYGSVIVMYKLFGKQGLFCFTSIATIAANIEVLIMVKAFGMVMTLGNVLFSPLIILHQNLYYLIIYLPYHYLCTKDKHIPQTVQ